MPVLPVRVSMFDTDRLLLPVASVSVSFPAP